MKIQQYQVKLVRHKTINVSESICADSNAAARIAVDWYKKRAPATEIMIALLLNVRNGVIGIVEVSIGGLHGCAITPADILRPAIIACAPGIILAHNHPSGNLEPSSSDYITSQKMVEACNLVGITLLDHLVIDVYNGKMASCLV